MKVNCLVSFDLPFCMWCSALLMSIKSLFSVLIFLRILYFELQCLVFFPSIFHGWTDFLMGLWQIEHTWWSVVVTCVASVAISLSSCSELSWFQSFSMLFVRSFCLCAFLSPGCFICSTAAQACELCIQNEREEHGGLWITITMLLVSVLLPTLMQLG